MKLPKKMGEYIRASSKKKNSCFVGGHGKRYFFCNCKLFFLIFLTTEACSFQKKIVSYFWITMKLEDHSAFPNNSPYMKKNTIKTGGIFL